MKGIPAGAMVELDPSLINEGEFLREMKDAIEQAYAVLNKRAELGNRSGKAVVSIDIALAFPKDIDNHIELVTCIVVKRPKTGKKTIVKEKNGRLLCQPIGTTADTPDQQRLFDAFGQPIGAIDRSTGEVLSEDEVSKKKA